MKKQLLIVSIAVALLHSSNSFGMLLLRTPLRTKKTMVLPQISQRNCHKKFITESDRQEFIQILEQTNTTIENIIDRHKNVMIVMATQKALGQHIVQLNTKTIESIKNDGNEAVIYDATSLLDIFDGLEDRLTKTE